MSEAPTATDPSKPHRTPARQNSNGSAGEVFRAFVKLGVSSFGGPIAHMGYFHNEFVLRRKWLDEAAYADVVALCQFLPGPASSQVGLSIGLLRAGYRGGLAAWTGFTLPSAILLVLFAYSVSALTGTASAALLHGLRLVAVAIVAQAVWGMARTLSRGRARASITVASAFIVLLSHSTLAQLGAIGLGAALGRLFCSPVDAGDSHPSVRIPVSRRAGAAALAAFLALLVIPPALSPVVSWPGLQLFHAFYRSGALVFGGGHVVLPLLRQAFVRPGWVTDATFLAGYGAAQAVPGPLFSFAAYLGAVVHTTPHGLPGAALGLAGIFLPGTLILLGVLPYWELLRRQASTRAMMIGVNAAVVGLLAAALYQPLWVTSVTSPADFGIVLVGFMLLTIWRTPPLIVVAAMAIATLTLNEVTGIT